MTPALRRACVRAVHVITPDGRLLRAGRASMCVLGVIGWPGLAAILSTPPLIWGVEVGYQIVARNRELFAHVVLTNEAPAPGDREL